MTSSRLGIEAPRQTGRDDWLTGLPHRAAFARRLDVAAQEDARRAVLLVDLDGFEQVNASVGHAVGDQLLVAVAGRLGACMGPGDTLARVGDDEFAILLDGPNGAAELAPVILDKLRAPFEIRGRRLAISGSIGIATTDADDPIVLRRADAALRHAKRMGGGNYQIFDPRLHDADFDGIALERDLARALEQEEFFLQYQPLVELSSARLVGVEALVRWLHPERGLVTPDHFIPLAEQTGLVVPLGRWVLRQACRQAALWQRRQDELLMSVNLSGAQLNQRDVVHDVLNALDDAQLDPRRLILEITETVLLRDTRETVEKLAALRAHGIRLAVDDFGTGYSSLQYLNFPVDILKIAKPFVDDLRGEGGGIPLARAIVGLGETISVAVLGEGIEFAEQREDLIEFGCQLGQGFLFGAPTDPAGIDALLADELSHAHSA